MGILGRDRPEQGPGSGSTIIGAGTELVGNLTLSDNLHLDGRIEGDIESKADVTIGKSGTLVGKVHARRVLVSGAVDGQIDAERLEIVAGGLVEGNVTTVDLVIEPGGRFNGSSEIRAAAEPAAPAPEKARKKDSAGPAEGSSSPA